MNVTPIVTVLTGELRLFWTSPNTTVVPSLALLEYTVWSAVTPRLVDGGRSAQTIFVVNRVMIRKLESNNVFMLTLVPKGD
jgi:hypothetical protein